MHAYVCIETYKVLPPMQNQRNTVNVIKQKHYNIVHNHKQYWKFTLTTTACKDSEQYFITTDLYNNRCHI